MAFNKSFGVVFLVVAFVAAVANTVSAQDLGELAPAPSPSMDKGAGFALGMPAAALCSSFLLSMLAFFKH